MRIGFVATVLIVIGVLGVFASLNMETSVAVGENRVHNLSLASQQQMFLLISGLLALAGIILAGFAAVASSSSREPSPLSWENVGPKCPACGGVLPGAYPKCQHCATDLEWVDDVPMTPKNAAEAREEKKRRKDESARIADERKQRLAQQSLREMQEADERRRRHKESLESLRKRIVSTACNTPTAVDHVLRRLAGEGNDILLWFFRAALAAVLLVGIALGFGVPLYHRITHQRPTSGAMPPHQQTINTGGTASTK